MTRFVKLVADRGARVTLHVPQPLVGLLATTPGVTQVLPQSERAPPSDFQVPMMSLPLALRASLGSVLVQTPYLAATKDRLDFWAERLGAPRGQRVGLVWSGDPDHPNDRNRSIALDELIQYLPENISYTCLQREIRQRDRQALENEPRIRFFGVDIRDFSDTAALCELMDVILTVDTSVAHLSGAMGRPTWLLLPFAPDFRWLLDRTDSPWYPTVRLFRQHRAGSWLEPLSDVREGLFRLGLDDGQTPQ